MFKFTPNKGDQGKTKETKEGITLKQPKGGYFIKISQQPKGGYFVEIS